MDGKGRCLDNVFMERLWRDCEDMRRCISRDTKRYNDARAGLKKYFWFYNNDRLHQSLDYKTPSEVYLTGGRDGAPSEAGAISLKSVA
ncbi:hypothetical protein FACS1894187_23270 [Synergistales bacterium]|nr:hypothetical protein FACS1894187_23270 [Synergistales bacterium]